MITSLITERAVMRSFSSLRKLEMAPSGALSSRKLGPRLTATTKTSRIVLLLKLSIYYLELPVKYTAIKSSLLNPLLIKSSKPKRLNNLSLAVLLMLALTLILASTTSLSNTPSH